MASAAEIALLLTAKDMASGAVNGLGRNMSRLGRTGSGLQRTLGTLARVGIGAVVTAAGALAATLATAIKSAADEQRGIASLDATLRANVKGWNGNRDAIEDVIRARIALGFTDDEQRASLTALVTKYKSVTEAQRVQSVAMDVARLRNISLEEATQLVMKAHDGSAKILRQLGIEQGKEMTRTERLAAIQKAAAGQAEAYGKTAAGAMDTFKVSLDNVLEDLGARFLPLITEGFTWLRTNALPAVEGIIDGVGRWIDQNRGLLTDLRSLFDVVGTVAGRLGEKLIPAFAEVWSKITEDVIPAVKRFVETLWDDGNGLLAKALTALEAVMTGPFKVALTTVLDLFVKILEVVTFLAQKLDELIELLQEASRRLAESGFGRASGVPVWIPKQYAPPGSNTTVSRVSTNTAGTRRAAGGWVGLGGPEIAMVGEQGPEYVVPNHELRRGSGVTIRGVTERELIDMVDRGLFFRLSRSSTTAGRV